MEKFGKVLIATILGGVLGVSLLVIVTVAGSIYAYFAKVDLLIPGVLRAWFTEENGLPAFNFAPHAVGMLTVIVMVAGIAMVKSLSSLRRREEPSR